MTIDVDVWVRWVFDTLKQVARLSTRYALKPWRLTELVRAEVVELRLAINKSRLRSKTARRLKSS